MVDFFHSHGLECPKNRTVADFSINVARGAYGSIAHLLSQNNNKREELDVDNLKALLTDYETNPHYRSMKISAVSKQSQSGSSRLGEIWLIAKRDFLLWNIRTPTLFGKIATHIFTAVLFASMFVVPPGRESGCVSAQEFDPSAPIDEFRDKFRDRVNSIQNSGALIYCFVLYITTISCVPTISMFPREFKIVKNEASNNWYRRSSYFIAKIVADIPSLLLHQFILIYLNLRLTEHIMELDRFFMVFAITVAGTLASETFGMMYSIIYHSDPFNAMLMCFGAFVPMTSLSGYLIPTFKCK